MFGDRKGSEYASELEVFDKVFPTVFAIFLVEVIVWPFSFKKEML